MPSRSRPNLRETLSSQAGRSVTALRSKTSQYLDSNTNSCQYLTQGAALCDRISSKLDAIITSIDDDKFSGKENDLLLEDSTTGDQLVSGQLLSPVMEERGGQVAPNPLYGGTGGVQKRSNHFSKVWLYSNSRLPPHLPPFKVYLPTWPLICLAATYSESVYSPHPVNPSVAPAPSVSETHTPSDWRTGTKAMVMKTLPIDSMNTIVFAIRGSATFMDWAVNYKSAPASPRDFLDDEGNLCHSGFLFVARKMVSQVAQQLRQLLDENPNRSHCSLLLTGHSAGGAVASLLYAHMMSKEVQSELTYLTSFFKRVHCITFGTPPISLLPLQRPNEWRHRKSLFYTFINEGDPVPRADKQVIRSLLKLYALPAPATNTSSALINTATTAPLPAWPTPPTTLSTAGRLVVLREKPRGRGPVHSADEIEAVAIDDELLRTVVYGDPLKHTMTLYKCRVDHLATRAVTAGGF
ncbi:alpha/beta-hydrolase [Sporormia fimetaria CBS 119925]|uniref:Alpha/beta-hydrolase n=1 Tax=Sporormia fimetaria CBS 119925 TaxID=1340428 RepID=A0A6A6VLP3_9PLEO|nr:alpha/beta-hydrolase [Sporormia fimetaria CBS 119925]